MFNISMIWENIKNKMNCKSCNRHWYIIALAAIVAWCLIF